MAEQLSTPTKSVLVLRDGEVCAPELVPVDGQPVRPALRCRPDVAYLIIGGLGALGLTTAKWLADRGARRLVLAGRTALPPRQAVGRRHRPGNGRPDRGDPHPGGPRSGG